MSPPQDEFGNLWGSKWVGNDLDLYRSTCNIQVITYLVPIVSTVDTLCIEHMKQISGSLGALMHEDLEASL